MLAAFDSETQSGLTGGVKSLSKGPLSCFGSKRSKNAQRPSASLSVAVRAYSGATISLLGVARTTWVVDLLERS